MKPLRKILGANLRALRTAADISQEALADAADISVPTVRRIERGAGNPALETLELLAAALKVPAVALLHDGQDAAFSPESLELARRADRMGRDARKDLLRISERFEISDPGTPRRRSD